MGKGNFSEDFKRDAVAQIVERGNPDAEVSHQLGVSQHSLYEWKKKFAAKKGASGDDRDAEILADRAEMEVARAEQRQRQIGVDERDHGFCHLCCNIACCSVDCIKIRL